MAVRAGFTLRGTSLRAWCVENGVDPHNARKALIGQWQGQKAEELVARLVAASGVTR